MARDQNYTLGGRRSDGRQRDDERMAERREDGGMIGDSGRWTTAPQLRWVQPWGLGDVEERKNDVVG